MTTRRAECHLSTLFTFTTTANSINTNCRIQFIEILWMQHTVARYKSFCYRNIYFLTAYLDQQSFGANCLSLFKTCFCRSTPYSVWSNNRTVEHTHGHTSLSGRQLSLLAHKSIYFLGVISKHHHKYKGHLSRAMSVVDLAIVVLAVVVLPAICV